MNINDAGQKKPLLILIDGSSYLHRAFHALPALTTTRGEPTGAMYGVINMIRRLLSDYNPDYFAVVFDAKGKNFRHAIYPEYKATREAMSNDLASQIIPLHSIIDAMGLKMLSMSGVEADDVIATVAKTFEEKNIDVLIATGDKDMAQIVNPDIKLIDTMSNITLDEHGVKNKFGVMPNQIIDYLALVGDTSDNIPGIPGVGPKTAAKWLNIYGSLDNIIEHANEIEGKVGDNLRQNLDQLTFARKLTTVKNDIELKLTLQDLIRKPEDKQKLIALFKHYEFRNWLLPLLEQKETSAITEKETEHEYKIILEEKQFYDWMDQLENAACFAMNIETNSLNFMDAEIAGIAFTLNTHESAYIPLKHDYEGAPKQISLAIVLPQLKRLLENNDKKVIGHNLKYDFHILANYQINLSGMAFDTMLESYILNSTASKHDLEILALKYLGLKIQSFEEIAGKGIKKNTFNKLNLDNATAYATRNTDITLHLHELLWQKISENENLTKLFHEIEMPLIPVLARMEHIGVCIDIDLLHEQSKRLATRIIEIENESYHLAGQAFNLSSPKQLQEILFAKMQLPVLEKTPTGQPSTAESVLQELAIDYPLPKLILEHRTLIKLKSTYTDALPKEINKNTCRVHTSFNQAITATGRLSSNEPNLQNIPIRTEEGRRIRQAFIAPKRCKILSIDYSQIELRIMAHLSQDENLRRAFANAEDIHQATAAEVFSVNIQDVTHEQRRRAKAINFGLIYGMSSFGLARQLGIDKNTAQEYIKLYFTRYPGVKNYMEKSRELAREQGFVETIFGRRLYVPDINAQNFLRRSAAERAAINAPLQGTAADIMKIAMIKVDEWIQDENYGVKMIMQVHDELVFEIEESIVKDAGVKIQHIMQTAAQLDVPIVAHVGIGDNWDQAH